jgi:hypothetical protein
MHLEEHTQQDIGRIMKKTVHLRCMCCEAGFAALGNKPLLQLQLTLRPQGVALHALRQRVHATQILPHRLHKGRIELHGDALPALWRQLVQHVFFQPPAHIIAKCYTAPKASRAFSKGSQQVGQHFGQYLHAIRMFSF